MMWKHVLPCVRLATRLENTVDINPEWRSVQVGHYCINCRILSFL